VPENNARLPTEAEIHSLTQYNALTIEGIVPLVDIHGGHFLQSVIERLSLRHVQDESRPMSQMDLVHLEAINSVPKVRIQISINLGL